MHIGPTPAVAIFSVFSRYKRESSRASVFAAKMLNEAGIRVTMKVSHSPLAAHEPHIFSISISEVQTADRD